MSALQNMPSNVNFLSPIGFRFQISNYSEINYYCQAANLPGVSINPITMGTPIRETHFSGDEVSFEELSIRFVIDENMKNWLTVYDWIISLGIPTKQAQEKYTKLKNTTGLTSDATLTVLTSHMNPQMNIRFRDCFPLSLSGINFDSALTDVEYQTADVTFRYDVYEIENLLNNETTYEGAPVYSG